MEHTENKDNISCHYYKEYLEKYGRKYYPFTYSPNLSTW